MKPVMQLLLAMIVLLGALSSRLWSTPPNIVLILADDQGWNGSSVQMDPNVPGSKSDFYQTPTLEQLAAQGMRFSQGYSTTPVCATTRASIQTGRNNNALQMGDMPQALPPGSVRWQGSYVGHPLTPPAPEVFDPTGLTLPRMIKESDSSYVTAHYGKWHLDVPASTTPQAAGYDFGGDPPLPPFTIGPGGARISDDPWGVGQLTQFADDFMQDRVDNNQPFFLQVSHRNPHPPLSYSQELYDKYAALPPGTVHDSPGYAAMIESLDTSVGTLLDKIDQLGIADNTYVIYASDNGAPLALSKNTPLRDGKASVREGGIRVPFIVRGPGITPGSVSDVPITTTDLYATISDLIGNTHALPSNVESGSFAPILFNDGQLPAGMDYIPREYHVGGEVYFHWPMNFGGYIGVKPSSAVRDGDYKLYVEWAENGGTDQLYLYNLATDLGESVNLASSMPEKTAELMAKLDNYLEAIDAPFAYDVKTPVAINWDAAQPGIESTNWRATTDLKYKGRETWKLGAGNQQPSLSSTVSYQPGLPSKSFSFDGNDVMRQNFIQVADDGPRAHLLNPGTPDWDRSASIELWVRTDSLSQGGVLMESGDGTGGISVTLGDADGDGLNNDMRFRVLGLVGADTGTGVLQGFSATAKIDEFSNPTRDFVHLVAVFNDDPNDRYQEIYVNGALAARVDAALGPDGSPQWDTYDMAGLGNIGGNGLGGNSGGGALPFTGGFHGEFTQVKFYNYAITADVVQTDYNSMLYPASYGVVAVSGNAVTPAIRPTNVSLGSHEDSQLTVVQERQDILDNPLQVDAIIDSGVTLASMGQATPGLLPAGLEFNSYLLQFDPLGDAGGSAAGSVTFEGEILGILFETSSLVSTDALLGSIGNYGDAADFNGDGYVDDLDLANWQQSLGLNGAGDADHDNDTDGKDFLIWQHHNLAGDRGFDLGAEGSISISADLHQLTFNLSTIGSDMAQFRVLTSAFAQAGSAAVPEPCGVCLLICGGLWLVVARYR